MKIGDKVKAVSFTVGSGLHLDGGRRMKKPYEMRLWLVEFYTKNGVIKFAWVGASTKSAAISKLKHEHPSLFDEEILTLEQERIVPLDLSRGRQPLYVDIERSA